MPRIKCGMNTHRRHKRVLKRAKGFVGSLSKTYQKAKIAGDRAMGYAYRDRRNRKREFRALWIQRINAAARQNGISYSRLIHGLQVAGVEVDRKVLAEMAISDPQGFANLAQMAKSN